MSLNKARLSEQIRELSSRIQDLRKKEKQAEGPEKTTYQEAIAELHTQLLAAEEKLQELQNPGGLKGESRGPHKPEPVKRLQRDRVV